MIKNWEYLREYEKIKDEILAAVDGVFSSGRLILGPNVARFEEEFAQFCRTKFAVGVNSGTDALFLALVALGIGAGDEVVTVSNTAVPTVAAIRASGAMPVFVDVHKDTYLMDISRVEDKITTKTKCVLPVHLYGHPVDMNPLLEICKKHKLYLVEDCAQSHGAEYFGKKTGAFGDLGTFSFYPTKILGAYGDAGMIVTDNEKLAQRLKMIRMYGMQGEYYSELDGYNSRLDEVQAAILLVKMKILREQILHRRDIARRYTQGLERLDIVLPVIKENCGHNFYLYVIQVEKRDELINFLKERNIEARVHFPYPIHLMRGYKYLGYKEGDLPHTEYLAGHILSLPLSAGITREEADIIIDNIRKFFKS
ncbi:MAG: DegT/DnrJ/EryC1/StrS family aminotransferase [Candidatus Omnitrophota bacterium]